MLIEFSLQNFASFNQKQTLSLLASKSTKENFNTRNTIPINNLGIDSLLKGATIFGANSSGKSNLVIGIGALREIVLGAISTADSDKLQMTVPFLIKKEVYDIPTEFEISFISNDKIYRYGVSLVQDTIVEEWLYFTKKTRETLLFHRQKQKIKINKRSFKEALDFVKIKKDHYIVEKTREDVPFISVLSKFNGKISREVINWFKKLQLISGIQEKGFKDFTLELLMEDKQFKSWALDILSSIQIHDIEIEDLEDQFKNEKKPRILNKRKKERSISVDIIKTKSNSEEKYSIPFALESDGTQKLFFLLGPLYDVIKNGEILIIDEFDSKFHTLLSKYLLDLYFKSNNSQSQLIATCHDTNLLTKDLLRRDQIWFIEKNESQESLLYSLLEYKEHYTRKNDSYAKDYLSGKYGAIPLFSTYNELAEALDG